MSWSPPAASTPQNSGAPPFAELVRELFRISRPGVPAQQFYSAFLKAITIGMEVQHVCIWCATGDAFQALAQYQLDKVGMPTDSDAWKTHQDLLSKVFQDNKPVRLKAGHSSESLNNPLNFDLFCVPFSTGQGARYLVEVFAVPGPKDPARPAKKRLHRLEHLCEYFRDYLRSQKLKQKAEQADVETDLRNFVTRLNAATTVRELAVVVANEGRQCIGCERVTLGWMSGRTPKILAVSGHDTIDTHANVIRALTKLTKAATQTGLALKTSFPKPEGEADPNAEASPKKAESKIYQAAVDSYPESDRPRHLMVIPLGEPKDLSTMRGAIIVEQFQAEELSKSSIHRAAFVADQIRIPLQRLELLESVPLLSWWSRSSRQPISRRIWRLLLTCLIIGGVVGLAWLPMDLKLPADGELLAKSRYAVFAPENGVVREVHADHGSRIKQGDLLITLDNLDLSARLRELTGQLVQYRERQRSLEARRSGVRLTEREQLEIQSGLVEAASAIEHTDRQIKLLQERIDRLRIVAPADGVVTSWNVAQTLLNRTVIAGDALMQQIEPADPWNIELKIPEDRAGYIVRHLSELAEGEPFRVEFVLATEPEHRYTGFLISLSERTELSSDIHVVRAVVALDPDNLPPLRDGAAVKARLNCGKSRAGFVWFRELIEVIQTYWWY